MSNIDWSNYIPVEGYPHHYRDKRNGAIINMNMDEFERARIKEKLRLEKIEEEKALKTQVSKLENDMTDIKNMLMTLMEKN